MILDDQVALHQSILNCSKFGDERDAILANLNFIQASWGSGQGYFSPNHPPVLYSDKNIFYRFKSVGYSFMYSDSNEEGQVVMSLKRPQLQPGSPDETGFLSALQNLVARPNILFRICGSKKFLENDEMSMIILVADDRNTLRRVLATDLAEALCQPMLKPQLEKLGVLDVSAKVKPGGEQLKAYLETPPPGMDVRVWKKAQEDNPDPENMIPFPLIGAEALKKRLDAQKKESAQHQQRLKVIGEEVASLANRHVNMNAELQQMRRRFTTLSHRILSAILRLLMIQMKDLPVQPEEENLRRQLASFQKEFNTAQDFRGRLNLLMEIVNLQRNENNTGGSGGETKSGMLDAAAFEQVKQLLKLQHECLKHLVGTVKSDLEVVNKMGETESERVVFNVTVETRGWVGFGLSRRGKMPGADIVIGGVSPTGQPYFSDKHAIGNQLPVEDTSQDYVLEDAWEKGGRTSLKFSRKFDTCDKHDIPINDDVLSILWSWGETDNTTVYHYQNRGNFTVYLRDPDLTPRYVEQQLKGNMDLKKEMGDVRVWTVENSVTLPAKRTTYWCNMHKISLPKKHHSIGFTIQTGTPGFENMHHLLLFRCQAPPNVNPESIFEPFVNHPGEECYSPGTMQLGSTLPTQYCADTHTGISIGGRSVFLPEHLGIPLGESENEYYLFQVHYDNPLQKPGIFASIKVNVYHTPNLRENDAGVFSIGHHIPGSPSLLLPPGSQNHQIYGHCSPFCTEKMFPPGGIKIVGALLHSHNAGRRLRIQHFRNGRELPWISNDDNFIVNYQPTRILREEVTILPGDQVTMRCVYDTTNLNTTTVGGYGTDQEMCKTFPLYYPKMNDYALCRSQISSLEYNQRYLGVENFTWVQSELEYVVTSPFHLEGLTLSEVSDTTVDWNIERRGQLQRDHILYPQVSVCPISTANPSSEAVAREPAAGTGPNLCYLSCTVSTLSTTSRMCFRRMMTSIVYEFLWN
ncbi:DBH-like monooxygenase protein 1 [Orchesella cincta]|uniref:DBH-like monooxygenase protein 1 n=1 Tax=Orchesella cincta TaxID=48709 RepID=A0A1D2MED6_ORCCI|nr:DBH-like monooxygenase protein 1 [Orchesella cincta]